MSGSGPIDVVCFSLEPWDDVWRRNQWFASEMLAAEPQLRLLFAELPIDPIWSLAHRQLPAPPRTRREGPTGRLWVTTPWKPLPRKIWSGVDRFLGQRVMATSRRLHMDNPVLWVNDSTYAGVLAATGYPSVYDITDDWLEVNVSDAQASRDRRHDELLVKTADEVVVCSPGLEARRGQNRAVHLITNGVDVEQLRRPQARPPDLPAGRVVLYQGTLKEDRLDIELCLAVAQSLAGRGTLVFVGPVSLEPATVASLERAGAVLLGSRSFDRLPAYLQHADVLVVPHRVSAFTESLDPIKAREFVALGRPTLSTPVAGFRQLGPPVTVASASEFTSALHGLLAAPPVPPGPGLAAPADLASWSAQARSFLDVLRAAQARHSAG
jgi:teichuronic acid biosynthesis glycosyltransferase TuaH